MMELQQNMFEMTMAPFRFYPSIGKPIRLFEAFAGVGMTRMAFKRIGCPVVSVGVSEIDKYALMAYKAVHGDCNNYGDISKMESIPPCDIFTYSFPCTDLSKAGQQKGLQGGTRSGLVYEVLRLLKATADKPTVLIMENVVDLVQVNFIRDFQKIQRELELLGYTNYVEVMNAKDYGVAQNRERVFMVSILGDYYYGFPQPFKLEKRLRDYLEKEVDEKYYLSNNAIKGLRRQEEKEHQPTWLDDNGSAPTIDCRVGALTHFAPYLQEPICLNSKVNGKQPSLQDRIYSTGGTATAITQAFMPSIAEPIIFDDFNGVLKADQSCVGTIRQTMGRNATGNGNKVLEPSMIQRPRGDNPGGNVGDICPTFSTSRWEDNCHAVTSTLRIRKLSPLECWRLMDIDDGDFEKAAAVVSNSQLYRQAGNGLTVGPFSLILKNMMEGIEAPKQETRATENEKQYIIYDGYNDVIKSDQDSVCAITVEGSQGTDSRHGNKIIEIAPHGQEGTHEQRKGA